jgi:hypothetical protein
MATEEQLNELYDRFLGTDEAREWDEFVQHVREKVSGLTAFARSRDVVRVSKSSISDYAARKIDSRTCARATNRRLR